MSIFLSPLCFLHGIRSLFFYNYLHLSSSVQWSILSLAMKWWSMLNSVFDNCKIWIYLSCFFLSVWLSHGEMVLFLSHSGVVTEWSHLRLVFCEIICFTCKTPWSRCKYPHNHKLRAARVYFPISLSSASYILCKGRNAHMRRLPWKCPSDFYTHCI